MANRRAGGRDHRRWLRQHRAQGCSRHDLHRRLNGADQRVTPNQALQAITINAAWQYGEEKTNGSIEVGKLADLVVLSGNPLSVAPMQIKDISVVETIKEGKTIYSAKP